MSEIPETDVIEFNVNDARIAEVAEEFKAVDAYKDLPVAKAAKKTLTKMRTKLAEAHTDQKADALAFGRRLDAEKNRLMVLIKEIEDPITEQLEEIKNKAAREEEERLTKIMQGIEQIQAFALDRHDLTLDQLEERLDTLRGFPITEKRFQEQIEDAENAKEVSESKLRIAVMNEKERIEEEAKLAATEAENKELRKKLDEQAAEQADRDAEAQQAAALVAAEQKVRDDERQAELDKQAEEQAAAQKILDDEQAEKERLEAEELAAKIAAIQAPDVEKLELYAADIKTLIGNKPIMQVEETNEILLTVVASLIDVANYIETKSEELK